MREQLKPGMTENELWSILHQTNIENYGEWIECRILSSGERTNPWMQECSNKIIQDGEIVSFDTDMVGPMDIVQISQERLLLVTNLMTNKKSYIQWLLNK